MILMHCCNDWFINFWHFSIGSLGRVGKLLTARKVWTFSTYALVFITTTVLPLSVWTSIACSVISFYFSCYII